MGNAAGPAEMSVDEVERIMESLENGTGPVPPSSDVPLPVNEAPAPRQQPTETGLKEFVNVDQLKQDVSFDVRALDEAVQEHAGLFVHYAELARRARRQFELMKNACEILESQLYSIWREQLAIEGKKVTEAMIDSAVKQDPRWWAAHKRVIDAKAIYDLANDAREAFQHRRDMIIQVSVDRRTERQGELRVMAARGSEEAAQGSVLKHAAAAREAAQGMSGGAKTA